jgi:hypothetical protein
MRNVLSEEKKQQVIALGEARMALAAHSSKPLVYVEKQQVLT